MLTARQRIHALSHGLHPNTLFVGEEYKDLVRGVCVGVCEKIELVTTAKQSCMVSDTV